MVEPISAATVAIPAAINAVASIGSGMLGAMGKNETKQQKLNRNVSKDLIASLTGEGPYSHLFSTSEADFQKGFVQPALSRFNNQIAPNIQQQYAYSGQKGTAMEDQLLRAGVDLNQMINENFLQYQQGGQNRALSALGLATGQGAGAPAQQSLGTNAAHATAGYLNSDSFSKLVEQGTQYFTQPNQTTGAPAQAPTPRGFSKDYGLPDRTF